MYARPSRRYVRRRYTRKPKAEVKTYVSALTTFSHDLGVEPDDPAITVVNPGFNTMANGTTNITRVGNVIGPCTLQIRYAADLMSGGGVADPFDQAAYFRVIVLQMKGRPVAGTPTPSPPDLQDLFSLPLSLTNAHLPPFKDGVTAFCRIMYDKVQRLDFGASNGSLLKRLRFNVTSLRWDPQGGGLPAWNSIYIYLVSSKATTSSEQIFVNGQFMSVLRYQDC